MKYANADFHDPELARKRRVLVKTSVKLRKARRKRLIRLGPPK